MKLAAFLSMIPSVVSQMMGMGMGMGMMGRGFAAGHEEQCGGEQPSKDLLYIKPFHWAIANKICCNNHHAAEPKGFLVRDADFFSQLDKNGENIFYDSVCGKPLFKAPVGRTYEAWKQESIKHGWPSFRPSETFTENVKVLPGGRMESVCGTHLGHNIPDGKGDRYCIDLVCMAGKPPPEDSVPPAQPNMAMAQPTMAMAQPTQTLQAATQPINIATNPVVTIDSFQQAPAPAPAVFALNSFPGSASAVASSAIVSETPAWWPKWAGPYKPDVAASAPAYVPSTSVSSNNPIYEPAYVNPAPSVPAPAAGRTFSWTAAGFAQQASNMGPTPTPAPVTAVRPVVRPVVQGYNWVNKFSQPSTSQSYNWGNQFSRTWG